MPSKQVVDRQKGAQAVVAAGETHGDKIATELAALFQPHLHKGEALPDMKLLVALLSRVLAQATASMVSADEAHQRELADDPAARDARDRETSALYASLVELREIATGLLGAAALVQLGLTGNTPQDPAMLARFAGEIVTALSEKPLPPSRVKGASLHAADWKDRLGAERGKLDEALAAVAREAREAEGTLVAKNQAIASYDERFTRSASLLAGLLRMAGEAELAARVRPSTRRPGQTAQQDDGSPTT